MSTPVSIGDGVETPREPGGARMIATLALAGLISGVAIVGVYELTLPTILANRARALKAAVLQVVPGSQTMKPFTLDGGALVEATDDTPVEERIYAAYDEGGNLLGYAIPGEGNGFQDVIELIYGYDPKERKIVGLQVLESRETPGLGDKIRKDAAFVANFDDLSVDPEVVVVKNSHKTKGNEVDAITGATISSKAVVKILNVTNDRWLSHLGEK